MSTEHEVLTVAYDSIQSTEYTRSTHTQSVSVTEYGTLSATWTVRVR
nr:MAG: hypothetical protein AmFV_00052 [Apis mellifera filamentous virus]WOK43151.1 MAG: hypothetical protein [Apis mellifera filamentous virus]WOK43452.1 MAG: hypothetical protein [Apis mellifera filamentous virus]WOK43679.1 MAG: hypothetical protein [Apis mellifera filamentous virus]